MAFGQVGISVSPPRVYYEMDRGQTKTEKVTVTNVSINNTLDLAVTLGDWQYNDMGDNMMYPPDTLATSCASWVNINGPSFLSLKPGESRALEVSLTVPATLDDSIPVHTAMLYVTQMNPTDNIDHQGANMKVSVRSGIKLFQRTTIPRLKKLEIKNMVYKKETNNIQLTFDNIGNVWTDGNVITDLVSKTTGETISLKNIIYYTMPGDHRILNIPLPESLKKGSYTATVLLDLGNEYDMEAAELDFDYE